MIKNESAILHISHSNYSFALSEDTVGLRIRLSKQEEIEGINVIYGCKYEFQTKQSSAQMMKSCEDELYVYYTVVLKLDDKRLAYVFEIAAGGVKYFFSEDGLTSNYNYNLSYFNFFQIAYINKIDVMPQVDWTQEAVFYQIFVDRFDIGSKDKDTSYIDMSWGGIPESNNFAGGDIRGIINRLDYIQGLGANVVYLTPIFESVSNHKYDTISYYNISDQFGNLDDLKELANKLHARGMKLVLDAVFNHSSHLGVEFQDVIKNGRKSKYFDWFIIHGDEVDIEKSNYEMFASCSYMPKWNTSNVEAQNFLIEIARYWTIELNLDGWRLDVADEISEVFWREFRLQLKRISPQVMILGENWHNANQSLQGDQFDGIMNYAFTKASISFFIDREYGPLKFAHRLNGLLMRNNDNANAMMLNLLDSHDTHRFLTQAKGSKSKLLSAFAVQMFYIGMPFIYYGTEQAMLGGYDPDCRRTIEWDESKWDMPFMTEFKNLVALRQNNLIKGGSIEIKEQDNLLVIRRFDNDNSISLYVNNTDIDIEIANGNSKINILANNYHIL